jgi:hypothetical protein
MAMADLAGGREGGRRWLLWLALLFLLLALLAFGYELLLVAEGASYRALAAGELWFRLHPSSLNITQAVIQRYVFPGLWDPVAITLLQWPAWAIFGLPGLILLALWRLLRR